MAAGSDPNSLPVSKTYRLRESALVKFPVEVFVILLALAEENIQHGNAVQTGGRGRSGYGCKGGEHIPEGPDLIADLAGFNFAGPSSDGGDADAALI
jgi:hypothetical protein